MSADPLRRVAADLRSPHPAIRVRAVGEARAAAERDPSRREAAAALLRSALDAAEDGRTAVEAARALGALAGPEEARRAWTALLAHEVPTVAAHAALSTTDVSYRDALVLASTRADSTHVRVSAARALGRSRDPAALAPLLARLADPDVRPHAIQALGELGDPRAIPHLEALFDDATEAWQEDNHGPMLHVGDLARDAVRWIAAPPVSYAPPGPPPGDAPPSDAPKRERPRGPRVRPLTLVPLAIAVLDVPWLGWVIIGQLYRTGTVARSAADVQGMDLAVGLPALGGLLLGLALLARWRARTPAERFLLALGSAGCALFVFAFGGEYLRHTF